MGSIHWHRKYWELVGVPHIPTIVLWECLLSWKSWTQKAVLIVHIFSDTWPHWLSFKNPSLFKTRSLETLPGVWPILKAEWNYFSYLVCLFLFACFSSVSWLTREHVAGHGQRPSGALWKVPCEEWNGAVAVGLGAGVRLGGNQLCATLLGECGQREQRSCSKFFIC